MGQTREPVLVKTLVAEPAVERFFRPTMVTLSLSVCRSARQYLRVGGLPRSLPPRHHVYIKPRTPRLNGKVERSHRTDKQEFYQLLTYTGDVNLDAKLAEWERFLQLPTSSRSLSGQNPLRSAPREARVSYSLSVQRGRTDHIGQDSHKPHASLLDIKNRTLDGGSGQLLFRKGSPYFNRREP